MSELEFMDFVAQTIDAGGLKRAAQVEDIDAVTGRLNDWLAAHPGLQILNVETVVLPNINHAGARGSKDSLLHQEGGRADDWHQLVRVWFRRQA
jgi:hypothetical protein